MEDIPELIRAVNEGDHARLTAILASGTDLNVLQRGGHHDKAVSIILLFSILVAVNTYKISLTSFSLFHLSISSK
jgi:hypothetical protein